MRYRWKIRTDVPGSAWSGFESYLCSVVAEGWWMRLSRFSFAICKMRAVPHQVVVGINEITPRK